MGRSIEKGDICYISPLEGAEACFNGLVPRQVGCLNLAEREEGVSSIARKYGARQPGAIYSAAIYPAFSSITSA